MENAAILVLSIGTVSLGVLAAALGVHIGSLRARISELALSWNKSVDDHRTTANEFADYKERTERQLESYRDDLNDLEDLLATCDDPAVIKQRFDLLLQAATSRDGGESPDWVP